MNPNHVIIHYYMPPRDAARVDGPSVKIPVGPYVAQISGYWHRETPVTDAEIYEYVQNMHGCYPVKIERCPLVRTVS